MHEIMANTAIVNEIVSIISIAYEARRTSSPPFRHAAWNYKSP